MAGQREAQQILVEMFSLKEDDGERCRLKMEALDRFEVTFAFLTEANFSEYVNYLQDWTLNEIDAQALQLFVKKLRLLHEHLRKHGHFALCERLFPICFHLLQQEDDLTRQQALSLVIEALSSNYGVGYTKNTVKKLLGSPYNYGGFDCALTIFSRFKERFNDIKEVAAVLQHTNLYSCFKSKKVLLRHLISLASEEAAPPFLELLLTISTALLTDPQETIRVAATKAKILTMLLCVKTGLVGQEACLADLQTMYQSRLIRMKYVLVEVTQQIAQTGLPNFIQAHFEFIASNIDRAEPELTDLVISNLKHVFGKVTEPQRAAVLEKLLGEKRETRVQQTIANNIIDLLIDEESQEVLVNFLNKFVKDKQDTVKIALAKSFFKHEKSKHLYVYFRTLLASLYESSVWRIRHQSLEVLEDVIQAFGVDESTMEILYNMAVNDKAYRIRVDCIQLIKRHLDNANIQTYLLSMIANEYLNQDYLRRLIVLDLIKETYHLLIDSMQVISLYKHVLKELSQDGVPNVAELAKSILLQCKAAE